ncbi:putative colanic acid biosynthesis acetyltransferase [Chitinibacter sp. SCUT-21]|uniref:putative colanic acid biosynthesis acetyltransferase n=1 Tax=Chitinibacter sp. SCUT-21 TaxID=2970891 RepID=UPI0035A67E70
MRNFQNLAAFTMPANFRGRSAIYVQLWWLVQATLFRCSPQFAYRFRAALLRWFGAEVGVGTVIRPSVTITYPWKVKIGDYAWIGDDVVLYSLGEIDIGAHAVVSQRSYLCAADHDYQQADFPIRAFKVCVEDQAWLATDVYVAPGVTIGRGAVIGARSSVFKNMPEAMVCMGSPCRPFKPRLSQSISESL